MELALRENAGWSRCSHPSLPLLAPLLQLPCLRPAWQSQHSDQQSSARRVLAILCAVSPVPCHLTYCQVSLAMRLTLMCSRRQEEIDPDAL
jgi:hypothetical protein